MLLERKGIIQQYFLGGMHLYTQCIYFFPYGNMIGDVVVI